MKKNTNKTNSKSVSSIGTGIALTHGALALRKALPVKLMARGLVMRVNPAKAPDSAFTAVAECNPGHTFRRGCGQSWGQKVTLVGRRHRCVCCNKIVPVEQESSNYCSGKCERTHKTQLQLTAMGFGRQSR